MEDERPIRPQVVDGPQIGKSAGNFFQTDHDLLVQERRAAKRDNKAGEPIEITSKVLCLLPAEDEKNTLEHVYVGESGFLARKINISTGKTVKSFKGHTGPVTCLGLWHKNGEEYLITGSWDKTLIKWNTKTKEQSKIFTKHTDFVKSLTIAHTTGTLYSGSSDRLILSWNLNDGDLLPVIMKGHTRGVEDLVLDESETYLYSASSDSHIRKWNPTTGECLQIFEDHLTSVYFLRLFDEVMWSASADKTVKRWDLDTGKVDTTFPHPDFVKCLAVLGPYLITGGRDEVIRVFDIGTGKTIKEIEGHFDEVSCMAIRGTMVYTGSLDCTVRRWSVTAKDLIQSNDAEKSKSEYKSSSLSTTATKTKPDFSLLTEEEEKELAELMESDDE
ncbi:1622_t:CDS:2 [Ambispora leptoticha]|uniref:1622_t:CDS:1 n=1 Tax=Ambispora leptoticha TaxID=144679 RepID=A0A9N9H210_9GLOM|nr:1622_t:CDS:2 [Ambispora leptoticha]